MTITMKVIDYSLIALALNTITYFGCKKEEPKKKKKNKGKGKKTTVTTWSDNDLNESELKNEEVSTYFSQQPL